MTNSKDDKPTSNVDRDAREKAEREKNQKTAADRPGGAQRQQSPGQPGSAGGSQQGGQAEHGTQQHGGGQPGAGQGGGAAGSDANRKPGKV